MSQWEERYRRGEHTKAGPFEFIERWVPAGEGRPALDVACGAGRHAVLFAERGWRVTAVDSAATALALVSAKDQRVETVLADLEAGEFAIQPASWDLICMTLYLERSLFGAVRAGVRPGGYLAAAFPMVDEREGVTPMRAQYLVAPGELRAEFGAGFEVLHEVEREPAVPGRRMAEFFGRRSR